jgi:glycosyltransferase involved in cell wall biosynthesis
MRIAFVNSSIEGYGGIERRILELGDRLRKKGHEVFYYAWYYDPDACDERYKTHVVKQMPTGFLVRVLDRAFHSRIGAFPPNLVGIPISAFTNIFLLSSSIRDCGPDFVFLSSGRHFAGLLTRIRRTRLICYFVIESLSNASILGKMMRPFERYTVTKSICFSNSRYLASHVMSRFGVDNVKPLYGGGGWARFYTGPRMDDGKTLLYFARFSPERFRTHTFLLSVLRLLSRSDVRLILAGGLRKGLEPYIEELRRIISAFRLDERVDLVTNVHEDGAPKLYSRATLYVDPNVYDYSNSIVEALEAGVPALVRGEGGQAELVTPGETGFHLGPHPEEWARCIEMLLEKPDLISAMSSKARLKARDFSWDKAAEILEAEMLRQLRHSRDSA